MMINSFTNANRNFGVGKTDKANVFERKIIDSMLSRDMKTAERQLEAAKANNF
jgi:hypothetical protein